MEQHPVPRNISSFQFHLIGDMTVRQFAYLGGGIATAYVLYRALPLPSFFTMIIAGTVALAGIAFAFLPIQDRPLDKWVMAFIKSILSPTQYVWQKSAVAPEILTEPYIVHIQPKKQIHQQAHIESREKLQAYLNTLPHAPHDVLNNAEKKYVTQTLALFNTPGVYIHIVSDTNHPHTAPTIIQTPLQPQNSKTVLPVTPQSPQATEPIPAPVIPKLSQSQSTTMTEQHPVIIQQPAIQPTPKPVITPSSVSVQQQTQPVQPPKITPVQTTTHVAQTVTQNIVSEPITKKILNYSEPVKYSPPTVIPPLTAKQIPAEETPHIPAPLPQQPPIDTAVFQKQLEQLAKEKEMLAQELARLRGEFQKMDNQRIVKPEMEEENNEQPTIKAVTPKLASQELGIPNVPSTPNLIVGVIKDPQRKLLPNIILTIKDKNSMPLRALKTNKIGQFATATPLSNGVYYLEAEDPLKRFTFDIAEITLSGKPFPAIEIVAKGEKEIMREKLSKALFGSTL